MAKGEEAYVLHFCVGHLGCMCGVVVDGAKKSMRVNFRGDGNADACV